MRSFVSKIFFKEIKIGFSILAQRFEIFKQWQFCTKSYQNRQKCKLSKFFMSILRGLKWFPEKNFRGKNCLFQQFLLIFYIFLIYDHPKGTKPVLENEKNVLFQKSFHQMYENCCKFSTNVAKKFVNNFLISKLFWKIFLRLQMVILKRKTPLYLKNKRVFLQIYP